MHQHAPPSAIVVISIIATFIVLIACLLYYSRRRNYSGLGENTIVRCREGHLFTTIWVPYVSFKAVRLGMARFQRCPIGNHWTMVMPVDRSQLTPEEIHFANQHHDRYIP